MSSIQRFLPEPRLSVLLSRCLAITAGLSLGFPALAAVTFSDIVAERNLAPTSLSRQSFPGAEDQVNRFNGALQYSIPIGQSFPVAKDFEYQLSLKYTSSVWAFDTAGGVVAAEPSAHFNAGFGWQLSWGRLLPPASTQNASNFWVYQSPAGKISRFYSTLNDGDTSDPNVFYSRDGRFLRLRTGTQSASVDFPNGQSRHFNLHGADWRLTSWTDASGNSVGIDYSLADRQVITDSHGRIHQIFLIADPSGHYSELIDRIELAAWNGSVASYQLAYNTLTVGRPSQDTSTGTPATVSLPVLSSVTRPDGSYFAVGYDTGTGSESGRLTSMRLPTGGMIAYQYGPIALPFYSGAEHTADLTGVSRRAMVDHDGQEIGAWDLQWQLDIPRQAGAVDQPRELTTSVTYPDGHRRDFYFSVYVNGNSANHQTPASHFSTKNYGLPMTVHGKSGAFFPSKTIYAADGQPLRSTQLRYTKAPCSGCWDVNPRLDRFRAIYHDDGGWTETTTFTQWNGLGRFGRLARFDSSVSAPYQVTEVDYATTMPAANAPWILGLFTERSESYGSETKTEKFCHDAQTGRLLRQRQLAGANVSAVDVVKVYGYDTAGNPSTIHYYGGDMQAIATTTTDLCALSLPTSETYAAYRSYSYGTMDEKGWLAADGSIFLTTYAATIDANTGKAVSSHRGDELTWTHAYDTLGRLVSVAPPAGHGGQEIYTYTMATEPTAGPGTGNDPFASMQHDIFDADGSVLSSTVTRYDEFGRVLTKARQISTGWATDSYTRDAYGRALTVTDPVGRTTQWTARDEFGRPLRKVPPEGAHHERLYTYDGKGFSTETFKIGKQWDPATFSVVEVNRTIAQRKDRLGRLIEKTITDADGQSRTETWTYSQSGHAVAGSISDGSTTHTWTSPDPKDGRGFVVANADGTPVLGYDALGKLTEDDFGQGLLVRLYDRAGRLVEEREGSTSGPLWVKNVYATSNDGNNYKKNKLVQSIRVNRDVPHLPDGYVQVQDHYSYQAEGGRVSARTTSVVAGFNGALPLFSFDSTASYNGLGQTTELGYPDCRVELGNPAISCERLPERTLGFDYQFGRLTSLDSTVGTSHESWIDQIDYDPDGFVTRRVFADGFIETSTADVGAERAARLTIEHPGLGTFYDSGSAVYDGNGKLVQLGNARHISDFAYALDLLGIPGDVGAPSTVVQSSLKDIYGLKKRRFYTVPYRYGTLGSTDGEEEVWEIYVYGPGNRTLWTREFNDYDAYNYGYSTDTWQLADISGKRVRERQGLTFYAGSQVRFDDAAMSSVGLAAHQESADTIFFNGKVLGTSDNRFSTPQRTFVHRDIRGMTLAITNQDGEVEHHVSILY